MNDFTRRVVVVTGASSGIGLAAARGLAARGDDVVLVGRHEGRLAAAADKVRQAGGRTPPVYRADFAVLDEVRALAEKLRGAYERIDVLANNAGLLSPGRRVTVDGHEYTIQVNHLSCFLLSSLLRDRLAGGRIVVTASMAENWGQLDPGNLSMTGLRYGQWRAYGNSKSANILFAAEAARRWPEIITTSYHPGAVRTRFGADGWMTALYRFLPFFRTPDQGADTLIWLATDAVPDNGGYYVDRKPGRCSQRSRDPDVAAALWEASERAVGFS